MDTVGQSDRRDGRVNMVTEFTFEVCRRCRQDITIIMVYLVLQQKPD